MAMGPGHGPWPWAMVLGPWPMGQGHGPRLPKSIFCRWNKNRTKAEPKAPDLSPSPIQSRHTPSQDTRTHRRTHTGTLQVNHTRTTQTYASTQIDTYTYTHTRTLFLRLDQRNNISKLFELEKALCDVHRATHCQSTRCPKSGTFAPNVHPTKV